jgi:polysaccharide pyruvyl transferase WcaK-like protein
MCQSRLPVNANLHLMADTALLLEPADAETVDEIFLKENLDLVGKPLIGWSIKGSMRDKRQINALARAIDLTINAIDCGVAIFPFHHPDDLQYAETVRMLLENKDQVEIVKEVYRPRDVLGLIGKCDMVVGMRLHSLVFAANRSVPFVSVSYDPKIDEFSREFGISPAVHTPLVGPEVLVEKIEDMWELRGRMRTKVTDTMKRLRGRATDGFRALGDFVDSLQLKRLRAASKVKKLSAGKSEK